MRPGAGCRCLLVEQGDLASGTSSASTKLIHGGLRYLEQYEFRLVREALAEREVLLRIGAAYRLAAALRAAASCGTAAVVDAAAGLVPVRPSGRPAHPARRRARSICGTTRRARRCSRDYTRGFEYSDCWVDDARLVVLNARDAADAAPRSAPRTRCTRRGARTVCGS